MRDREKERDWKKAYYAIHREEILAKSRAYRLAHPEETKARKKADYESHKNDEKRKNHRKIYYETHREQIAAQKKAWALAHPALAKERNRKTYLANREKMKARARAYHLAHREEKLAISTAYRIAHRAELKEHRLKRDYGITQVEFDQLFKSQGGRCAICKTDKFNGKGPAIDHDHLTGKVRGLLCHNCNMGIGHFKELTHVMRDAIAYLDKHSCGWTEVESCATS